MGLLRRLIRYRASSTIALICLLTFAAQLGIDPVGTLLGQVTDYDVRYGFVPLYMADEPWRAVTGVFLHIAPWHLMNNVGFLLLLGTWLERDIGAIRLATLFAAGAIAGDVAQLFGDPETVGLGASAGLMAIAAAALVMEREAPFARERRLLALLVVSSTLGLGLVAPAFSALAAHTAGAVAGLVLAVALPRPVGVRMRNAAESEAARVAWAQARSRIIATAPSAATFELRPTAQLLAAAFTLLAFVVVIGVSTVVQAGLMRDATSAGVAAIVGIWTVAVAVIAAIRFRRRGLHVDLNGVSGRRLKRRVIWSEIESLYPGRIYAGLAELGAIGFIPHDGKPFGIQSAGHPPRELAARLEGIRLAAAKSLS